MRRLKALFRRHNWGPRKSSDELSTVQQPNPIPNKLQKLNRDSNQLQRPPSPLSDYTSPATVQQHDDPQGEREKLLQHNQVSRPVTSIDGDHGNRHDAPPLIKGVLDLRNTTDTDKVSHHAPAVIHETVRPHEHEIVEEQIFREIHTHDAYHYVQPVYDVEVLPARHFVPDPAGGLIEVAERDLPHCTGSNQGWSIEQRAGTSATMSKETPSSALRKDLYHKAAALLDGHGCPEDVIFHEPTLAQTTPESGPVWPVHFDEHGIGHELLRGQRLQKV